MRQTWISQTHRPTVCDRNVATSFWQLINSHLGQHCRVKVISSKPLVFLVRYSNCHMTTKTTVHTNSGGVRRFHISLKEAQEPTKIKKACISIGPGDNGF